MISPAITAATAFLAVKYLDVSSFTLDTSKVALLGAAAYIAGDYGYNKFFNANHISL